MAIKNTDTDLPNEELEVLSIDTPADNESAPVVVTEPAPEPPKKKTKLVVLIVILSVLVLGGLTAGAYFLFFQPKTSTDVSTQAQNLPEKQPVEEVIDYAKIIIDKVRANEQTLAMNDYELSNVEDSEDSYAPPYQQALNSYYVTGDFGHSLIVSDTSDTDPMGGFTTAAEKIANDTLLLENEMKVTNSEFNTRYVNQNVVCSVSKASYPVSVSCANIRDYKAIATQLTPFATAYFDSEGEEYKTQLVFATPVIEKKADGYANATVSMGSYEGTGGFAGLFYSTGDTWTFWQGTQSIIACEDYNSYALQKSFEGEDCYKETDGDINSKVTVTLKP